MDAQCIIVCKPSGNFKCRPTEAAGTHVLHMSEKKLRDKTASVRNDMNLRYYKC